VRTSGPLTALDAARYGNRRQQEQPSQEHSHD
jgi:hypothetical protein